MHGERQTQRRVTIGDIAARAGVSKGAVSYALNRRPGISDETRARILGIADELGWYPNRAARALSVARADACGFALARPARTLAIDAFFAEFLAGVEAELVSHSLALTLQLTPDVESEIEVYRRWWGERRVDGVLMMDLRLEDPRLEALDRLGLPAVIVGGPAPGSDIPCIWHDEQGAAVELVRYLAALGHTRIARVEGMPGFFHSMQRSTAFLEVAAGLGLTASVASTDYTPESGVRATRRLLSEPEPPTAIAFDSPTLGVSGLGVAQQMGLSVPEDMSIVAWDDSLICQVVHPPLTTLTRDITAFGSAACRLLREVIDTPGEVGHVETPRAELTPRASTGPAPRRAR